MAQTNVPVGSAIARKLYSTALFTATQRQPTIMKNLMGPAPKQSDAEAKLKGQTSPDMPVVRVTDLSKTQGEQIAVDMFNIIGGKPIMGDRIAEGRGEELTFSSMNVRIDLATKVVDAGGKMTQQRTLHNLRGIALANLMGYMPRLEAQQILVHLAGARGSVQGMDWVVPLSTDPDFADIMVNTVQAPTYNRHFVASGTSVIQGGAQLNSIASTDILRLEHIDSLRAYIDDAELKLQPVKIEDDPAANDEPLYVMLVSARQYQSLLKNTSNLVLRTFQQNAWNRASYGSKHPLFKGEVGIWNGILVKKIDRAIRFNAADTVNIITQANRYAATETTTTVAAIGATNAVDRALLLGAQAMATVYGKNQSSDYYYSWHERQYNFERNLEVAGDMMNGKAKVRFSFPDGAGNNEPTDHGVIVLDTAVNLS